MLAGTFSHKCKYSTSENFCYDLNVLRLLQFIYIYIYIYIINVLDQKFIYFLQNSTWQHYVCPIILVS